MYIHQPFDVGLGIRLGWCNQGGGIIYIVFIWLNKMWLGSSASEVMATFLPIYCKYFAFYGHFSPNINLSLLASAVIV